MITPIEMYSMVPKSAIASNIKHQEAARPAAQQSDIAQSMQQTIDHNNSQTVRTAETDNPEYRYDSQGKGGGAYSGGDRKKGQKKEEKKDERKLPPGCFDVRI